MGEQDMGEQDPGSAAEVRGAPEAIDERWLTAALEDAGIAQGAIVEQVEVVGDIGEGLSARTSRLALGWDRSAGAASDRPATLVGKFPSSDPNAAQGGFGTGSYRKEFIFYDRIASTVDVRTPRCHVARFDDDKPDFVLLMEDLDGARPGDQLVGLSPDEVDATLGEAVRLHAPRFGDPTIERTVTDGQPVSSVAEMAPFVHAFYADAWSPFLDRLGHRLDPEVAALVQGFAPVVERFMAGTDTPRTLVHNDLRADNLLFVGATDAPDAIVVDWQSVSIGVGGSDVAYLIGSSFADRDARADVERELVVEYGRRLRAAGVDLDDNTIWCDYRHGSLWAFIIIVIASLVTEQNERGDEMFTQMIQRHGHQALELDALSLLS